MADGADGNALFAEHHRGLFRLFCRAVGQAEAARDLTQDVFLRATRSAIPATTSGGVKAWLFRIARNLALDYHRSRGRTPELLPIVPEGAGADGGSLSASQDVGVAVNESLASLAALDRDVFLMREVAGLGYDEIARACELTPDAVRSRIHRARLQLRERLAAPIATHRTVARRRGGPT